MKKIDVESLLLDEMKKHYKDMGTFKDDKNPQIIELYNKARGGYDAVDDIYYKLFHHYANIE